jgi:hypothetical protein
MRPLALFSVLLAAREHLVAVRADAAGKNESSLVFEGRRFVEGNGYWQTARFGFFEGELAFAEFSSHWYSKNATILQQFDGNFIYDWVQTDAQDNLQRCLRAGDHGSQHITYSSEVEEEEIVKLEVVFPNGAEMHLFGNISIFVLGNGEGESFLFANVSYLSVHPEDFWSIPLPNGSMCNTVSTFRRDNPRRDLEQEAEQEGVGGDDAIRAITDFFPKATCGAFNVNDCCAFEYHKCPASLSMTQTSDAYVRGCGNLGYLDGWGGRNWSCDELVVESFVDVGPSNQTAFDLMRTCRATDVDGSDDTWCTVTFSGSNDARDWRNNILGSIIRLPFAGRTAHGGFVTEFRHFRRPLLELVSSMNDDNCKQILLLGHSLGGALASMAGHLLRSSPRGDDLTVFVQTWGEPSSWTDMHAAPNKVRTVSGVSRFSGDSAVDMVTRIGVRISDGGWGAHEVSKVVYLCKIDTRFIRCEDYSDVSSCVWSATAQFGEVVQQVEPCDGVSALTWLLRDLASACGFGDREQLRDCLLSLAAGSADTQEMCGVFGECAKLFTDLHLDYPQFAFAAGGDACHGEGADPPFT